MKDWEYNEKSLLSTIAYAEGVSKEYVQRALAYTKPNMFLSAEAKNTYNLIKEMCSGDDIAIYGTKSFGDKLRMVSVMEYPNMTLDEYILDLKGYWCPSATIDYWIKKVQEQYFENLFTLARSKEDVKHIIAEQESFAVKNRLEDLSSNKDEALKEYEQQKNSAIFTSYPSINKIIGSLIGGDMIVLAGATSSGKTCLMLNLLKGIAKTGKRVLVFSLEMTKTQLQQRIASSELGIDSTKFRTFTLSAEEKAAYSSYVSNELKRLPIELYPKRYASMETIKNVVLKSKADLVAIDYLGLISGNQNKASYERYSDISREIKLLANESNKAIIALHQLNRAFNDREDKTPKVSDLRDSGKIEQDADMIWLVYRPAQFNEKANKEDMRFIVGKNRAGVSNKEIQLVFNGMYQQISEPIKV